MLFILLSIGGSSLKIVKRGSSANKGGNEVQGMRVESPSSWSLRTLQGGRVMRGHNGPCSGRWSILLVVAGKQGVGASFKSKPMN